MKTFTHEIKIPDIQFTVHENEILKDFLLEPGTLIEFIKKAVCELDKIDNDIVKIKLKEFKRFIDQDTMFGL